MTRKKLPFISIVSLNWNSYRDTLRLLKSLEENDYPKNRYEIIIVDNGSTDGSVEKISKAFPKVKIIGLDRNYGLPARNLAIKMAKVEIVVNADSDAIVPREALKMMVDKIQDDPEIGILGVKIINKRTGKPEYSPMYLNFYTGSYYMGDPEIETENATWVPPVLAAIPKKTFEKVGYFDSEMFAFAEDMNFCLRVRKAGLKVVYDPEIYVWHYKSKLTSDVVHKIKFRHYYRNLFRNIYLFGSLAELVSTLFFQLILSPGYWLTRGKRTVVYRYWGFWWFLKTVPREIWLLMVTLGTGIVLRLMAGRWHDFWFDEAFTYEIARLPIKQLIEAVLSDNNPPLYYLIIHWMLKLGQSEVWLRLTSVVANIMTMFLIIKLGGELVSKRVGLIGAGLFAVSPLEIYMATEARLHSLGMFLATMMIYRFLKLAKAGSRSSIIIFAIVAVLGLYTQYYLGLLFLPFTWLVMRSRTKLKFWQWIGICVAVLVLLAPWLGISMKTIHNGCSCPNTMLSLPAALVSPVLGGVGEVTLRSFWRLPWLIWGGFGLVGMGMMWLFGKGIFQVGKLKLIYLVPLGILSGLGIFWPVFSPKAFGVFSPSWFLIVSWGISKYKARFKWEVIIVGLLASVSVIQLANPFFKGTRLKPVAEIVKSQQGVPMAHTSVISYYSLDYYTRSRSFDYAEDKEKQVLITENPLSPVTVKYIGGEQQEIGEKVRRLWLVDSQKWAGSSYGVKIKKVFEEFKVIEEHQIGETKVWLLERK